jgi:hypothetical protein
MTRGPKLDIFSGQPKKNAIWIETVVGMAEAVARMEQLAVEKPGPYFLYSSSSNSVVMQIERHPAPKPNAKSRGNVG